VNEKMSNNSDILLVVENSTKRQNLSSRFRMSNLAVEAPTGGFHALHLIEKYNHKVMIVIDQMSDMSANEIVSLTRNIKDHGQLPIVYIAESKFSKESIEDVTTSGADRILESSDNFQNIINSVRELTVLEV